MISVIIPAYNCEKTIERCINSILNQTYVDFEVVVVNDGSTDLTAQIVETMRHKDSRLKLIYQTNSGVSAARNTGINNANGEYLTFVDSDDFVAADYLRALSEISEPKVLSVVNFAHDIGLNAVLPTMACVERISIDTDNLSQEYLIGNIGKKIAFSVWNKLFCKNIIFHNNIRFNRELTLGEDMLFVLQYLCYCESIIIDPAPYYFYLERCDSAINSGKDFAPRYEKTYGVLESFAENSVHVKSDVLSRWSLEIMPYILLGQYVASSKYSEFKTYFNNLLNLKIVKSAKQNKEKCPFKKMIIQYSFKLKSPLLLFALIKSNKTYRKIIK